MGGFSFRKITDLHGSHQRRRNGDEKRRRRGGG